MNATNREWMEMTGLFLLLCMIVYFTTDLSDDYVVPVDIAPTVFESKVPVVSVEPVAEPIAKIITKEMVAEIECLALNMYHEARNQSVDGQIAVAMVSFNRMKDRRFPSTICGVVKYWPSKKNLGKCAFSWYCDGKSDKPLNRPVWKKIKTLAELLYHNQDDIGDITKSAVTHYHRSDVNPYWLKDVTFVKQIGVHKFYQW
jgi:N-acetylmuramoyl-L-alanine amidase